MHEVDGPHTMAGSMRAFAPDKRADKGTGAQKRTGDDNAPKKPVCSWKAVLVGSCREEATQEQRVCSFPVLEVCIAAAVYRNQLNAGAERRSGGGAVRRLPL